ncbi:MAG: AAA-like domain-containing protein, partial [Prochlorotrichaceae cyanobacterium]
MLNIPPPPTGAMPLDSPYYIQRPSDRLGLATIENQGVTLSITGTRQVGKTSLLARLLAAAQNQGKQKVSLDFQGWEKEALRETELFYRRFCAQLSARLDLSDRVEACWQKYGGAGSSYCCSRYVQDYLLEQVVQRGAKGLVIALDEVETLIDAPFRSEFFGLLRSWHNARAAEPNMKALDLILVSSTEPYELIEDLNQSPFNVGTELKLEDFTLAETEQLNAAYQQPLQADELAELYKRVGGHP